jgi:hypothetical protein
LSAVIGFRQLAASGHQFAALVIPPEQWRAIIELMKPTHFVLGAVAVSALVLQTPDTRHPTPQFTADGRLIRPAGWEEWVMIGASTGLSYTDPPAERPAGAAPGIFHNIYLQQWAYRYVMERGVFPEGAMLVMSMYEPSRKSAPARSGFYEGNLIPMLEVHLKRAGIDSTGWAFYGFGETDSTAAKIPGDASCYSCHKAEAAFDQAFVQFYPAIRERLLGRRDQ